MRQIGDFLRARLRSLRSAPSRAPKQPVFCVVDPELRDRRGHYFDYDRTIAKEAERSGYRSIVLARRDFDTTLASDLTVLPTFALGIWDVEPSMAKRGTDIGRVHAALRFFLDLRRGLHAVPLRRGSVIFGQVMSGLHVLGWALLALRFYLFPGPKIVVVLRFQTAFCQIGPARVGFRILEFVAGRARFEFVSDSHLLAWDYQALTSLPIGTIPIPVWQRPDRLRNAGRDRDLGPPRRKRRLQFVSLGDARDEKGILELLSAIDILAQAGQDQDLEFVLHVYSPQPENVADAIRRARQKSADNVKWIDRALSSEEYEELLASADVVVAPYWTRVYRSRTSGPIAEALAAGKPVVVTKNTWMASWVQAAKCGIVCADRDPSDLARSILLAQREIDVLRARSIDFQKFWRDYHNPPRLLRAITTSDFHCPLFQQTGQRDPNESVVAVVLSWPLRGLFRSGAGTVIRRRIEFLSTQFARVVVLQPDPVGSDDFATNVEFVPFTHESRVVVRVAKIAARLIVAAGRLGHAVDPRAAAHDEQILREFLKYKLQTRMKRSFIRKTRAYRFAAFFLEYPFAAEIVKSAARMRGVPSILTNHDLLAQGISTPLASWLVSRFELAAQKGIDHVVCVSPKDRDAFRLRGVESVCIPNSVDVNGLRYLSADDPRSVVTDRLKLDIKGKKIALFVGAYHRPNVEAAAELRRFAVAAESTDVVFVVAGSCAQPERASSFIALGAVDDLTFTALYAVADVVLCPLKSGTGMSVKAIEALALGKVVVGSHVGFRGIPVTDGVDCVVEDDIARYPEIISKLVADRARHQSISEAARLLGQSYDYRTTFRKYLELLGIDETGDADSPIDGTMVQHPVAGVTLATVTDAIAARSD